ncbi:hypothetical protein ZOSMA_69G00270 [Zostera marina]|uniref:Uncharacterized protein n=1 Tax=Zostera marina TaxID=29655 RepID=A0A0K9NRD1_ZOSMR|nr:hypothetical protein ZOSMA_69G00270 [Zostera marina]
MCEIDMTCYFSVYRSVTNSEASSHLMIVVIFEHNLCDFLSHSSISTTDSPIHMRILASHLSQPNQRFPCGINPKSLVNDGDEINSAVDSRKDSLMVEQQRSRFAVAKSLAILRLARSLSRWSNRRKSQKEGSWRFLSFAVSSGESLLSLAKSESVARGEGLCLSRGDDLPLAVVKDARSKVAVTTPVLVLNIQELAVSCSLAAVRDSLAHIRDLCSFARSSSNFPSLA